MSRSRYSAQRRGQQKARLLRSDRGKSVQSGHTDGEDDNAGHFKVVQPSGQDGLFQARPSESRSPSTAWTMAVWMLVESHI